MAKLSRQFNEEMRSECGHTPEEILARRSQDDFRQLQSILTEKNPDPVQLQNAINILGRWDDPVVVPDIVGLLPRLDERGLINAIDALGRLGGPKAANAVIKQAGHSSPDVRRFVVAALNRIGTKRSLDRLATMARKDPAGYVRARARDALKARGVVEGHSAD